MVSAVTRAAVTSAAVPEIAAAFATFTAPLVAPPTTFRSAAAAEKLSASLMAIATSVSSPASALRFEVIVPPEDRLPRASTTPVVNDALAFATVAIAAPSAAVTASATVTGVSAVPRTTFEAGVTSAAVTSAILPEIATLLATVAVPDVARPIAFKSDADTGAASASVTLIVRLAYPFTSSLRVASSDASPPTVAVKLE